jgi:Domain of unknown function (DUF4386)
MTPANNLSIRRTTALLLVLEPVLFFAAFAILASAINWPASLGLPYNEILPAIAKELTEVRLGYSLYLASSLLTLPLGLLLLHLMREQGRPLVWQMTAAFMAAAALFKALGITRWLIAMPALANLLGADPANGPAVQASFIALNEYAGAGLGEWMGVGLMSGLWMLTMAFALRGTSRVASLLLVPAGIAALALLPNEFSPFAETSILQAVSRTASMLAQFWLAMLILRKAI